jgi:hypothetical protein
MNPFASTTACTNSDNKISLKIIDKPFKLEDIKRGETFD